MRTRTILCALLCATALFTAQAQQPVATRTAAQNVLFEEQYQSDLKRSPQSATSYGDYRYNDQLDDDSLAAAARNNATDAAFLARLTAIPATGFPEQEALSHDILTRTLQQRLANFSFKEYEMPLNQMSGPHLSLADLPNAVPLDTLKHYEDYLARLHQIPRVFTDAEASLRAGMKDNLMPVKFLLEKIPVQCEGIIAADPFLNPTKKYPASISPADQQRLTKAITEAVNAEVLPAYKSFATFVATTRCSPAASSPSTSSTPAPTAGSPPKKPTNHCLDPRIPVVA
jgi:uncharacterized protein (DUF885 family)